MVSHRLVIFDGYLSSASGDVTYLICQNYLIEGSCNFMSASSYLYVTFMPGLVATGIVVLQITV